MYGFFKKYVVCIWVFANVIVQDFVDQTFTIQDFFFPNKTKDYIVKDFYYSSFENI
jgi:hypothetical protein